VGAAWCGLRWFGERGLGVFFGGGVVAGDGEEGVWEEGGEVVVCHCGFDKEFG